MGESIKETVAKNLLYYRKKNKITQKELADKLGVKHNAISSWENGVNSIDIDTLFRVCQIFGVTVNDMYGMHSDYQPTTVAAHFDGDKFTPEAVKQVLKDGYRTIDIMPQEEDKKKAESKDTSDDKKE